MSSLQPVDQHALKTGQFLTIVLLLLAFIFNWPLLVAFVGVAQLLGGFGRPYAPYRLIYQKLILPSGILRPRIEADHPEPHRFAMLVGAGFNAGALLALLLSLPAVAWGLVWVVIVLANVNFWLNFCLGCWVYYQLNRLHVLGFHQAPIE